MYVKFNKIWFLLTFVALLFSSLYIYYTLTPNIVSQDVYKFFSHYTVEKSIPYHKENRLLYISSFLVQLIFLLWFVFGGLSIKLSKICERISGKHYYLSVFIFFLLLWIILKLLSLPFSFYSYRLQVKWGFSVQTIQSWWLDYIKNSLIDIVLSSVGIVLLFFAINKFQKTWWVYASIFLTAMLFLQNFIWPSFIAPMFNKFTPITDPAILSMVNDISKNAGIKIDRVEEMDASKRTTLANAYFYGFGNTSKIVLYDTLLKKYPQDEIKAVIAHEAAHWKENHVLKSIIIGSFGIFIIFFIFNILLKTSIIKAQSLRYSPYIISVFYLFMLLVNFDTNPIQNFISRQMERQADLLSVQYLHDKNAVIKLQVDLAEKSLSDVEPPKFIEWFSYTHPSAMNRIRAVEKSKI
ncbi:MULTISPECIES: M48 family metallopeptidase [unclassified Thermoanaerobacterium]|uniref:M48 family metallopeptidase n=1 Tax=unclassified Thermoanaerobacterium TaxID=2622527 RepID=UPI000A163BA7|nr:MULTISPECIES: M48 family metallopeptidase [unclassified Thermoanaerobacterium]MDE4542029.1 M48 family metallopeptidase [Thermoanaerobacterium sp. R66]ORX24000.1 endopeptidase [Thermoanaerobacterium sp. PSU-2]